MERHAALAALAPILRRQFGVVTSAQAAEVDVDGRTLRRFRSTGLFELWFPAVLRCTLVPDSWEARALAAQFAAGPHAVLGGWAAARLLGLVRANATTELDLLLPRGRRRRTAGPPVRTSRRLREGDVTAVGRFRCLDVVYTVAELARLGDGGAVERIAGRALAEGRCTDDELAALAERLHHVPGVPALRALLPAARQVVIGSRSRAEARFVRLVTAAGLPRPLVNLRVTDAAGAPRFLDAAWPDWSVAAEIDVYPGHGTTLGRSLDGRRQNDLVPTWTILRFDGRDLVERPDDVVRQVERVLRAAGWTPATLRSCPLV